MTLFYFSSYLLGSGVDAAQGSVLLPPHSSLALGELNMDAQLSVLVLMQTPPPQPQI